METICRRRPKAKALGSVPRASVFVEAVYCRLSAGDGLSAGPSGRAEGVGVRGGCLLETVHRRLSAGDGL